MIWHMEKGLIHMQKVPTILVNGSLISRMEKGMRNGLMGLNMKVTLRREKDMGEENLNL